MDSEEVTWLANQIFSAFPEEASGVKFYVLDCGCIYYQRVFADGNLDPQIGIYRDAEDGACEMCLLQKGAWKDRVSDESIVHNPKFKVYSGH